MGRHRLLRNGATVESAYSERLGKLSDVHYMRRFTICGLHQSCPFSEHRCRPCRNPQFPIIWSHLNEFCFNSGYMPWQDTNSTPISQIPVQHFTFYSQFIKFGWSVRCLTGPFTICGLKCTLNQGLGSQHRSLYAGFHYMRIHYMRIKFSTK